MFGFLTKRGKQQARESEEAFGKALAGLHAVRSEGIEQLRQQLRDIQAEVHVRESSIPSIPPDVAAVEFEDDEPVTSPELSSAQRRPAEAAQPAAARPAVPRPVPRPAPRPPPIPREEPDEPGDSGAFTGANAFASGRMHPVKPPR